MSALSLAEFEQFEPQVMVVLQQLHLHFAGNLEAQLAVSVVRESWRNLCPHTGGYKVWRNPELHLVRSEPSPVDPSWRPRYVGQASPWSDG